MKKEKETFANEMITYVNELKIVSDPTANKNLNS